jgi:hypothetical protein
MRNIICASNSKSCSCTCMLNLLARTPAKFRAADCPIEATGQSFFNVFNFRKLHQIQIESTTQKTKHKRAERRGRFSQHRKKVISKYATVHPKLARDIAPKEASTTTIYNRGSLILVKMLNSEVASEAIRHQSAVF